MPTYDFRCFNCTHQWEDLINFKDDNPRCPKCDCESERLIGSNIKPIFKGDGFYETDYKSKQNDTLQ